MKRLASKYLLGVLLTVALSLAGVAELQAQCNWDFFTAAAVHELPMSDQINSHHVTDIRNVDCVHSFRIALRATVLHDNALVHVGNYVGGPAVLGQFLIKNFSFPCSLYSWRSTTRGGTRFLGINIWYSSATSNILFPGCNCPDSPPGGGSPTEIAVLGGGTRLAGAASLGVPPLPTERFSHLDGVTYAIDQWAVVEGDKVRTSSSRDFAGVAEGRARAVGLGPGVHVVVEAPIHPHNERWIARPEVTLEDRSSSRDLPRSLRAFARIEFSPEGEILDSRLLYSDRDLRPLETALLLAEIQERVRLVYASGKRHRGAAFVELVIDPRGEMKAVDGVVMLFECRCGPV